MNHPVMNVRIRNLSSFNAALASLLQTAVDFRSLKLPIEAIEKFLNDGLSLAVSGLEVVAVDDDLSATAAGEV